MLVSRRTAVTAGIALAGAWAAPRPCCAGNSLHRGRCIRLPGGRRLHFSECGTPYGQLVLYFHGTPGSHVEATLGHEEFETSNIRLVAVNRPGMGRSTYQTCRQITDWPADVACLLQALGHGDAPFGIIAMSGGAAYALAVARVMRNQITHIALVSGHTPPDAPCVTPGDSDDTIELVRKRPRLARAGLKVGDRILDRNPDLIVKQVTKNWTEADKRLVLCNPTLYCRLVANLRMASCCGPDGIVRDISLLGSCWGFAVREAAGVSYSIWQGGCDRIVTPSMARYFHSQLPGSELFLDPCAGHVTMFKWHLPEILARFQGGSRLAEASAAG